MDFKFQSGGVVRKSVWFSLTNFLYPTNPPFDKKLYYFSNFFLASSARGGGLVKNMKIPHYHTNLIFSKNYFFRKNNISFKKLWNWYDKGGFWGYSLTPHLPTKSCSIFSDFSHAVGAGGVSEKHENSPLSHQSHSFKTIFQKK